MIVKVNKKASDYCLPTEVEWTVNSRKREGEAVNGII
jgi:hypothetical protein